MNQDASIGPRFFASSEDKDENYITIVRNGYGQSVMFKNGSSCCDNLDRSYYSSYQADMLDSSRNAGIFTKSNKLHVAKDHVNTKNRLTHLSDDLFCNIEMDEFEKSDRNSGKSTTIYSQPVLHSPFCRVILCLFAILSALLIICTAVLLVLYFSFDSHSDFITFIQSSVTALFGGAHV